jgi:hypothetical protein
MPTAGLDLVFATRTPGALAISTAPALAIAQRLRCAPLASPIVLIGRPFLTRLTPQPPWDGREKLAIRNANSFEAERFERESKSLSDDGDLPIVYLVNLY